MTTKATRIITTEKELKEVIREDISYILESFSEGHITFRRALNELEKIANLYRPKLKEVKEKL